MTDKEALKMALEFIERVNKEGWILADFEPQMYEAIAALKERLAQPEQEPVAYAGVKVWVGNQQVVRCLTQTELHYAVEPWLLVELNALKCIASFKEKKT
jgi:hypothetical protein